jgi:hypothetical protein
MTYLLAKQEKQQQHHKRQRPETLQLTGSKLYEDLMDWQKSEAAHENYTSRLRGFMTFLKISSRRSSYE